MKSSQPYQPFLLRILHGLTGIFLLAAIVTAFWTYDTYDGRWGRIPLPHYPAIESLHGTFGLYTLLIFPVFALYAFRHGQRRLIQPDTLSQLSQPDRPIWWYSLNRIGNTLAILALTFALFSGKMMDEKWLPNGELNHAWYYAHLIAWVVMILCIALHLLLNARVGGVPLLLSMWNWQFRPKDSPKLWLTQLSAWWSGLRSGARSTAPRSPRAAGSGVRSPFILRFLEAIVLLTIVAGWIIPLFK